MITFIRNHDHVNETLQWVASHDHVNEILVHNHASLTVAQNAHDTHVGHADSLINLQFERVLLLEVTKSVHCLFAWNLRGNQRHIVCATSSSSSQSSNFKAGTCDDNKTVANTEDLATAASLASQQTINNEQAISDGKGNSWWSILWMHASCDDVGRKSPTFWQEADGALLTAGKEEADANRIGLDFNFALGFCHFAERTSKKHTRAGKVKTAHWLMNGKHDTLLHRWPH